MNKNVVLYTLGCPNCKMLKMLLDKKGIQYTVNESKEEMEALGITSIPTLQVGDDMYNYERAKQWAKSI